MDPSLEGFIWKWEGSDPNRRKVPFNEDIIPFSYGLANAPEFSLDVLKLGDGYEQVTETGIRSSRDKLSVVFDAKRPEVARALLRFFKGEPKGSIYYRRPSEYFWAKLPHPLSGEAELPKKFRADNLNVEFITYSSVNVTVDFIESFEP